MRRLDSDWGADQRSSPGLNWEVIICTTALVCFGTVMVFSATSSMGAGGLGDSANFGEVKRHLMSILLALCAAAVVYRVPMNFWYRHSTWLLPVGLLLLASVFLPVIGKSVNGARRWLQLGPLSIQASEMVKLCALIYAAAFTVKRQEYMHSFSKGFFPMAIVMVIIAFMLMQQPDLGATVVVSVVIMGVLFLGGLSMKIFLAVGTVIVAFVALMIFMTPWRLSRVLAYLDPWSDEYVLGQAYQLSHSLIAFGRGELFGVGLGGSVEKTQLPARGSYRLHHGCSGGGNRTGRCYPHPSLFLLAHSPHIRNRSAGDQAGALFPGLLAQGVGLWFGVQAIINIGVASGAFPTKGLTLPFVSFGGSSMLSSMIAIGLLLRVDRENQNFDARRSGVTADNKQQTAADGRTLVIAAAGTGGHVMPGLAVARVMADRGWKIVWIGTTTGMEKGLVERQGIEFHPLNFQGMRGRGITGMITGGIKMLKAIWDARKLLKKLRPTAVFSTGGYIAVPVCFAAQNLKRPIVLMNCDADLLMSTNTVLPFCDALACGFAGGARTFAGIKGHTTGNPVRAEIAALPAPAERFAGRTGPLKLFIFGGSLGAQVLNDVLPQALAMIPESERPIVLHQTGRDRDAAVREAYAKAGVAAEVVPFIDDMAARYRESDLVLCRSGATSCSELCAAGAAAVLVPFIAKTTKHQLGNAKYLADQGGGLVGESSGLYPAGCGQAHFRHDA